jgi:hypothetical protein
MMNDTSVSAAVRSHLAEVHESLTDVHMGIPAGDILDRARRRHARRGRAAVAAAAGTVGSLAVVAALLAAGGAARTGAGAAQLTAWTVSRQANGDIRVTIRELKDPAGLQREMRADGVPASVRFSGNQDRACRPYPASQAQLARVYPVPYGQLPAGNVLGQWHQVKSVPRPARGGNVVPPRLQQDLVYTVIRPSALPSGSGVQITSLLPPRLPPSVHQGFQLARHGLRQHRVHWYLRRRDQSWAGPADPDRDAPYFISSRKSCQASADSPVPAPGR